MSFFLVFVNLLCERKILVFFFFFFEFIFLLNNNNITLRGFSPFLFIYLFIFLLFFFLYFLTEYSHHTHFFVRSPFDFDHIHNKNYRFLPLQNRRPPKRLKSTAAPLSLSSLFSPFLSSLSFSLSLPFSSLFL